MALSAKKQRFAEEFIVDLNATKAAKRTGYSEKTAYSQGHRLLKDAEVLAEIERHKKLRAERLKISQDMVLKELWAVISAKVTDFGKIITVEKARIVTKVKNVTTNNQSIDNKEIEGDDENKNSVEFEDVEEIYNEQVLEILDSDKIDPDKIGALSSIKMKDGSIEIKQCDKVKAIDLAMKHLGMYENDNKQKSDKIVVNYTQVDEEADDE
jgi:phage terminase small subunit